MSQSNVAECPICGKSFPMLSINQHVEDCLTMSETSDEKPRENTSKSTQMATQKKAEVRKSSFFSPAKKLKDVEASSQGKSVEMFSPKLQKRDSTMAGKSESSPPGKRVKVDSKQSTSAFFQKPKENTIESSNLLVQKNPKMIDIPKSMTEPPRKSRGRSARDDFVPLAEKMRPCCLEDYVGQSKILGNNCLLRSLLEANEVPSMILWGPPGCGKTSLAHIIANNAKKSGQSRFVTLSATTSGINDVKEVIKVAKNEQQMFKRKTILFMDEIHRFNKSQQDTFLPHVENGTIILIGATTENPSFQLNTALLSRCRVIVLEKLSTEALQRILVRAVRSMGCVMEDEGDDSDSKDDTSLELASTMQVVIQKDAIIALANFCDGDARAALNGLQLAVQSQIAKAQQNKPKQSNGLSSDAEKEDSKLLKDVITVNVSHIKEGLQRTHLLYDKKGEEHYNIISALHKAIRGSDANASLYWLARMLAGGEDPLYVARRLVRMASEDIGLADPDALTQTVAAYQACHFIGMPECDVILAQAVVYLARAPKSIEVYKAYNNAKKCVKEWDGPHPSVPLHIRNAPTKMMKDLGYGAGYKYNPDYDDPVEQSYLPPELENVDFF